jgi:hypothetical protein
VYRLEINSAAVLAHLAGRQEDEYLVDCRAAGLRPELYERVTRETFARVCADRRSAEGAATA